jgi:hypothetical protein
VIAGLARATLLACLVVAPLAGAAEPARRVPVPTLPAGPVELRVAHVVNPRFPRFTASQVETMLEETQRIVRAHFGVELRFGAVETSDIDALFARFGPTIAQYLDGLRYDIQSGAGDRARIVKALDNEIRKGDFDAQYAFAAPYLTAPPAARDVEGLAAAAAATMLTRLMELRDAPALDGGPTIDGHRFNEWVYWDAIGYAPLSWDVIITNQLLASADYYDMPIHAAVRGGIDAGSTHYSRDGRYGTVAVLSTYAFTSTLPSFVVMRGGETYDDASAARLSGAYLSHEIGHQLFHFQHPFGNPSCVMTPAELLKFRQWYEAIDPARCPIGSSAAMRPGAAKFNIVPRLAQAWR